MRKVFHLILLYLVLIISAKRINKEKVYQKHFAEEIDGKVEVVLYDNSRVDIVTDEYAIEVDFANKWAEGIGQALYYSIKLDKKAGILLIMENENDNKYLQRLLFVCMKYDITVWVINKKFESRKINGT